MSSAEVFRFVTIRPPQKPNSAQLPAVIDLNVPRSALAQQLRDQREAGARNTMVVLAKRFVASPDFLGASTQLDPKFAAFIAALRELPTVDFWSAAAEAYAATIGEEPGSGDPNTQTLQRLSDSVVASAIDASVPSKVRELLVEALRALWLIVRLSKNQRVTQAQFANAALVMPPGIFPVPADDQSLEDQRAAKAANNAKALAARRARLTQLAQDLASRRAAIEELLTAHEHSTTLHAPAPPISSARSATIRSLGGFVLPTSASSALSPQTLAALAKAGLPTTSIDVPKTVASLERRSGRDAAELHANTGARSQLVKIGGSFLPHDALDNDVGVLLDPANTVAIPGPCAPTANPPIPNDGATVPAGHGEARVVGIADLLMLEQRLLRYQLGEISRIENVLRSEQRSRRFHTKDSTEVSQLDLTETTTENEQDLSSTVRFQLQTESQTVIDETTSKDAGLTVHASYGPSVDATANYNTSSGTSSQQSNQTASNYAREVSSKAVQRVQSRTLTSRTRTTLHVVTEDNRHGFDNSKGTDDIVGVYRFVDKVYEAQIVNYGKRLMLEFIVPEPAAFLRFALTNRPIETVTVVRPDVPGYCQDDGVTFVPLQATDLNSDNYLYWAAKYGAQDVTSAPPPIVLAQGAKKSPDSMPREGDKLMGSDTFDIAIPSGYLAQKAHVNAYGETQLGEHRIVVQIQGQQITYSEPSDDGPVTLDLLPTQALSVTVNSFRFHNWEVLVTVTCTRSAEKYQDWQLKTFSSIINAYNDLKSAYDQAVREAQLQAADPTGNTGTNPAAKRIMQQVELKKGCLSLLTGQRFDLFDAVNRNVAPYGYPEIDFVEAKAEGVYVSAFEQSFEWNNMVYLFYPYFWGQKVDWPTISQLTDTDPVFQQFLQAGAARVRVPVRPGFEAGVLSYLSTGKLWNADGTLINADSNGIDEQSLSIIDELRSQTGNNNSEGVGLVSVTKASAEVVGSGTTFTADDVNRRIVIAGVTCIIKAVANAEAITLTAPFPNDSATAIGYAMGGKLVGQPWEVIVPTNLVKLDDSLPFS